MSVKKESVRFLGWVIYDGECPMCLSSAVRLAEVLRERGFRMMPSQAPWAAEKLKAAPEAVMNEIKFLNADGSILGGAEALLKISNEFWWLKPASWLTILPGVSSLYRVGYGWIARNRYCLSGSCPLPKKKTNPPLLGVGGILGIALLSGLWVSPLIFMWIMCFGLFFSLKWLCIWRAEKLNLHASLLRKFVFVLLWPGMNIHRFLDRRQSYAMPKPKEVSFAISKYVLGCWLLWCITPIWSESSPYFASWIGLVGFSFVLHFGIFHLLSLCWKFFGYNAQPIMNAPLRATSIGRFWGLRWNLAFHDTAFPFIFVPLLKRFKSTGALLLTFFFSGLIHELVISLPARGGYGLPTLYFLLQGVGILIERSEFGKKLGLRGGVKGWLFVFVFTALPAPMLFHPKFIYNVVIPFLKALNAW